MPDISTAMRLSKRRGLGEVLLDSLFVRDIQSVTNEASNVKSTFSSWDNCMQQSYCKWPVIIGIVVGSLILLSILTCIIRCACCARSCCCSCFSCLKCCQCCGDCCVGSRKKPPKHDMYSPAPQGYHSHTPMSTGPQFASFEVGKNGYAIDKVAEDALPPMPSWDTASRKHILQEDEKNNVEMGELDPNTGQKVPLMTSAASPLPSPVATSPYGARPVQGGQNGYMGVPQSNTSYRGTQGPSPMNTPNGRFGTPPPQAMFPGRNGSPAPSDGYTSTPGGLPQYANGANQRFGPPPPQRQYSGGSGHPPPNVRQFSDNSFATANSSFAPRGPARMPSPANNDGFEYSNGSLPPRTSPSPRQFGTPASSYQGSPAPPTYATRTPPPQDTQAYPGYRPYQPQQNNNGTPPRNLMAGLEPDPWSPVGRR